MKTQEHESRKERYLRFFREDVHRLLAKKSGTISDGPLIGYFDKWHIPDVEIMKAVLAESGWNWNEMDETLTQLPQNESSTPITLKPPTVITSHVPRHATQPGPKPDSDGEAYRIDRGT